MTGKFTRYGDVLELIADADDRIDYLYDRGKKVAGFRTEENSYRISSGVLLSRDGPGSGAFEQRTLDSGVVVVEGVELLRLEEAADPRQDERDEYGDEQTPERGGHGSPLCDGS